MPSKPVTKACATCGKAFTSDPRTACCSHSCAARMFWGPPIPAQTCPACKKTFRPLAHPRAQKRTYCSRACHNLAKRDYAAGVGNPRYKHGKRVTYNSAFQHRISPILLAAATTCAACNTPKGRKRMEVHHINGNKKDDTPGNHQVLCVRCHRGLHRAQYGWAKRESTT